MQRAWISCQSSCKQSWCMCDYANHSHQMVQLHPGKTGAVLIWVGIFMIFTALLLKRSNAGTSFLSGDLQLEILIQILTSSDSVLFSYSSIPFFYSGSVLFRLKFWLFRFCNYYVFVPIGISWPHHNPEKQRHLIVCNPVESNIPSILWFLSLCAPEHGTAINTLFS